jgi:hypothetical protein
VRLDLRVLFEIERGQDRERVERDRFVVGGVGRKSCARSADPAGARCE